MFAVIVTFQIAQGQMRAFMPLMLVNARDSIAHEPGCHQFDVATDPSAVNEVFLYELYTDETAFALHLRSEHFKIFDAAAGPMIESKAVRTYKQVNQ